MAASSTRNSRFVRRSITAASRRGIQFVRRASLSGVAAASIFAAGEAAAVDLPPALTITADNTASSIGGDSITFTTSGTVADRKLTLTAQDVSTANRLAERLFDGTFTDANIDVINPATNANSFLGTTLVPVQVGTLAQSLTFDGVALNGRTGLTTMTDTSGGVWFGKITVGGGSPIPAGDITFATRSDDGSDFWVDLNNNGTFEATERIVNNLATHGAQNRAGSVNLAAGSYNVAVAWYEATGGEYIEAKYAPGVTGFAPNNTTNQPDATWNAWTTINTTDPAQAGAWSIQGAATDPNFSANNVTMNGSGTIDVDARPLGTTRLGTLTLAPGVTLTKTGGALSTPSTTISGVGTVTINTTGGRLTAGALNTSGAAATFVKAGAGALTLAPSSNVAAGSSITVSGGTLDISNNNAGLTSVGGAPITLSGGTLSVSTLGVVASIDGAGLREGRVPGAFNVTDPNPGQFGIKPGTVVAEVVGGNNVEPWPDNQTWVYSGQMNFPDNGVAGDGISEFAFAEHVDDSTQVMIDGVVRLNNNVWNAVNTTGRLQIPAGWHDIEVRFGEGTGGAGPSTNTDADGDSNNPWDTTLGFGVDLVSPIAGDFKQPNYVAPRDDGTMNLFRAVTYAAGPVNYASNVNVTENSVIQRTGPVQPRFGQLSIAAGKSLTIRSNDVSFSAVNLNPGTQTIVTEVNSNLGQLTDNANTGVTLVKSGAGSLDATNLTNDLNGSAITVQQGRFIVTNDNSGNTSLDAAPVTLSGGTLELRSVVGVRQSHVGDSPFTGTFVEDVLEPGTTLGSNYLVFHNVNLEDFTLATTPLIGATARAPINAIEIKKGTTSISLKFGMEQPDGAGGDDGNSQVTGPAGVNNTATWNNLGAGDAFNQPLPQALNMDVSGIASPSGATVTWSSAGHWSSTGRGEENNTAPAGENRDLMAGYLDTGGLGGVGVNINVADLPASLLSDTGYDLYVYIQGGVNGRGGDYTLRPTVFENPDFASNVVVTANSTIDVTGPGARLGDLSIGSFTLTKTGASLALDNTNLTGNATFNTSGGDLIPGRLSDATNTTTLTKSGAGTMVLNNSTNDLNGTTINIAAGGILANAANALGGSPAVNLSNNGVFLRAAHADALAGSPITVARSSFVDIDVMQNASPKITVDSFGALVGKLGNISYGTGANQVSLANNAVLGPDAGETNLPAPGPAGHRLLLGVTANNGTYSHGTETSTGPTDLYRGVAIGAWTDAGALAATLNGPTGGDLNIHIIAPPALMPGNLTFKNIATGPTGTQFNSTTGTVNMLGQGRVIINGGNPVGGTWTRLNRTGDPTFLNANNVVLELGGGTNVATPTIAGGTHVMIRHGSFNLPGGGGTNTSAVGGTVNILEGGTIILDDANPNQPAAGIFNVTGTAGTQIIEPAFGLITDINGDGVGDALDVSAGPGAIYTNQTTNVATGATWNVGPGFLLVIDNDNAINGWNPVILQNADYILDDSGADSFGVSAFVLGNGRRLTTAADSSSDMNDNTGGASIIADPSLATTPGAKVILSAAEARTLDLNNRGTDRQPNFAGVTLQIGSAPFTTTQGLNTDASRAFDQIRVGRVARDQTGQVRLAGARASDIIVASGFARFEDDVDVRLVAADGTTASTGNFTVQDGTLYIEAGNTAQPVLRNAILAGNLGRTGSEVRLEDGGAFKVRLTRATHTVPQIIRTTTAGKSYLVLQEGEGSSGNADANFTNVTLANNSTLDLGLHGGNTFLRATINATAGGGAIENNASNTNIVVNVNAGAQPITFTGSRFTNLGAPVVASGINLGDGLTRSGRLSVGNLANIGSVPVTISPFSQLGFSPGTGNTMTPNAAQITQGSGTLRAQSGTVDFGTAVVAGSTVAATAPAAGLQHSVLSGSNNFTEANANTDVQLGTLAAKTPFNEATFAANGAFGQVNSTHVYTGQFFDADGIVAFGENFDDSVLLVIDGRTLLNNTAAGTPTASPDDAAATPGLQTVIGMGPGGDGWHNFEVRLSQGTGGVGTTLNNNWQADQPGFGFNPNPGTSITSSLDGSNYKQLMLDNGGMNLFRYTTNVGAGDMIVDANATLKMGGFTGQDSLALNGSATQTANLTLVNGSGTNTLLRTSVTGLGAIDNAAGSTVETGALTMANSATLTKLGGGTLNINGAQTNGTTTTITVSAGTANINTNAGSNTARNTTVNANSTTNFGAGQHLAALNIGAGATATLTSGGPKNLVTNALSIAGGSTPTGKLDVTDNAVIVDYPVAGPSPAPTIRDQIIVGRGGTGLGKPWNGLGISSTTAQADVAASPNSRSVGYAVNADLPLGALTTFRGQAVDPSSVLVRYTRTADANLDGVVNDDDVTVVGTFYAPGVPKPEWAKGDFDFNGFVDDDDVTLLGVFYNPAATPIPSPAADAGGAGGVAAVPEPASWLMLTLGGLGAGLFGWRRRKSAK